MQYGPTTYLIDQIEVRSKVVIYFLGLDLTFLNIELEELDDNIAPRPKDVLGPLNDLDPPRPAT